MRITKTKKVVKEVIETTEDYYTCDKCSRKIVYEGNDAFEFNLSLKEGRYYPGSGCGEIEKLDLCNGCAIEAIDLLKTNGFNVYQEDWDY